MAKLPLEKEIQNHIWSQRENWSDLIDPFKFPDKIKFETESSLYDLTPKQLLYNSLLKKLEYLDSTIRQLELIGVEVPLENSTNSTIRADFLATPIERPGIAIIELKRSGQTEREAFTELLAYSNHLNSIFPTHCKNDTILVLIAPMEGRTVMDAYLQSLLFENKSVYILKPIFSNPSDLSTLRLVPLIPDLMGILKLTEVAFDKRNFMVRIVAWEDTPEFWNVKRGEQPTKEHEGLMNNVAAAAAQLMEARGIHGFVYTNQLWPELAEVLPYANSLVIVGLNPYAVANSQFYATSNPKLKRTQLPEISMGQLNIMDLLPGLKKRSNNLLNEGEHLQWLYHNWDSHLIRVGIDVIKMMNLNLHHGEIHNEFGRRTWDQHEANMLENIAVFQYDVRPTGIIRELYWQTTFIDYQYQQKNKNHPFHGDMFGWAAESITSHLFFDVFLRRMFGDNDD